MLRFTPAALGLTCALVSFAVTGTTLTSAKDQPMSSGLRASVDHAMEGQRGTAVVLDVHSGEVLAAYHLDVAARRVASPGSSIKPFTLLALLESGKVDAHTALMCKREVSIGRHRLDCSHPETREPLDPAMALAYSCNSYFTQVASRLTPAQLQQSLTGDGFAATTGLAADESAGSVALAQTPEQLQLQAIGEWGVKATPLEMVEAYRRIAQLQVKGEAKLTPLFAGLEQSVAYGMGHGAQPPQGMKVAGKTGTAPAEEGAWTHAWFAGYAPAKDPEIALVVFLEKGHGGSDAAAVAREIFTAFEAETRRALEWSTGARP